MRTIKFAIFFTFLLGSLVGCSEYSGYYDSNGNYVPAKYADEYHNGADGRRYHNAAEQEYISANTYTQPGYYDYYGNLVTLDQRTGVPKSMFPPRGMCRVWFPDRELEREPGIESCEGIRARVPVGAYVIYGG
jgi:hypothetical protein